MKVQKSPPSLLADLIALENTIERCNIRTIIYNLNIFKTSKKLFYRILICHHRNETRRQKNARINKPMHIFTITHHHLIDNPLFLHA